MPVLPRFPVIAAIAAICVTVLSACTNQDGNTPLPVVEGFDAERYLGTWHQVAAIPAWFQRQCVRHTTATYMASDDGRVAVLNACERENGTRNEARGLARFTGARTEGRLEVSFVQIFGWWFWPAGGDYWVLGLGPDYDWSVVGEPGREFAWILARDPEPGREILFAARQVLEDAGYDTCRVELTLPDRTGRLCDSGVAAN